MQLFVRSTFVLWFGLVTYSSFGSRIWCSWSGIFLADYVKGVWLIVSSGGICVFYWGNFCDGGVIHKVIWLVEIVRFDEWSHCFDGDLVTECKGHRSSSCPVFLFVEFIDYLIDVNCLVFSYGIWFGLVRITYRGWVKSEKSHHDKISKKSVKN